MSEVTLSDRVCSFTHFVALHLLLHAVADFLKPLWLLQDGTGSRKRRWVGALPA